MANICLVFNLCMTCLHSTNACQCSDDDSFPYRRSAGLKRMNTIRTSL